MEKTKSFLCLTTIFALSSSFVSAQTGSDVNSLLTKLFTTNSYNKKVRPLTDQTRAVETNVDFYLNSVIEFDEQDENLKTSGFLALTWTDQYLTWTPANENNIDKLFIPQDDIWKPDVSLRNTFKSFTGLGASYLNAYITYNGTVEWNPYQVLESTCSVDITYFPFDTQTCELKFTAWSYTKDEVELNKGSKGVQLETYVENSQWELSGTSARETNTDEAAVFFSLNLRRRPHFYIINVIMPVVFLSALNVISFVLPVSSGERASYSVTVFLALAVFLTIVAGELPKNSETTSLLSVYLMLMSSLSTMIVIVSIAEVRLAARDEEKQPISKFFLTLAKLSRFLKCKRCKRSVRPADDTTSKASLSSADDLENENISWKEVVDEMDVVFFIFSLLYTFISTLALGLVAVHGG